MTQFDGPTMKTPCLMQRSWI